MKRFELTDALGWAFWFASCCRALVMITPGTAYHGVKSQTFQNHQTLSFCTSSISFFIILLLSSTHNAPTDNGQQLLLQTMGRVSLGFLLFQAMHHSSCPSLG